MSPQLRGLLNLTINQALAVRASRITVNDEKALKINAKAAQELLEKEFPTTEEKTEEAQDADSDNE